ncbi:Hypothetical_protein [Hexamita inflata]|uniref:Hypothetical_protein n=1 Tax=Hexamita inflata TaxID=28002 RepID=A0AA86UJ52_9EUKA|nr:Hypothetical protein HINF_LOCUS45419 [Hexamita inflata]
MNIPLELLLNNLTKIQVQQFREVLQMHKSINSLQDTAEIMTKLIVADAALQQIIEPDRVLCLPKKINQAVQNIVQFVSLQSCYYENDQQVQKLTNKSQNLQLKLDKQYADIQNLKHVDSDVMDENELIEYQKQIDTQNDNKVKKIQQFNTLLTMQLDNEEQQLQQHKSLLEQQLVTKQQIISRTKQNIAEKRLQLQQDLQKHTNSYKHEIINLQENEISSSKEILSLQEQIQPLIDKINKQQQIIESQLNKQKQIKQEYLSLVENNAQQLTALCAQFMSKHKKKNLNRKDSSQTEQIQIFMKQQSEKQIKDTNFMLQRAKLTQLAVQQDLENKKLLFNEISSQIEQLEEKCNGLKIRVDNIQDISKIEELKMKCYTNNQLIQELKEDQNVKFKQTNKSNDSSIYLNEKRDYLKSRLINSFVQ